jgi:hypothetical protein
MVFAGERRLSESRAQTPSSPRRETFTTLEVAWIEAARALARRTGQFGPPGSKKDHEKVLYEGCVLKGTA